MVPILGTRVVPESALVFFQNLTLARSKLNPLAALISPSRITIEDEGFFYFLNPVFIVLPALVFYLKDRKRMMLFLPPAIYILSVYLLRPASNLRYYIPMIPACTILLASLLDGLGKRRLSESASRRLLPPIAILSMIPTLLMIFMFMMTTPLLAYASGKISRHEYLLNYPLSGFAQYMQVVDYVEDSLSDHSVILMLLEARSFDISKETLQDNAISNWPLLASKISSAQDLRALGISHILVNDGALQYYSQRGVGGVELRWDTFQDFAKTELHPVLVTSYFSLYAFNSIE